MRLGLVGVVVGTLIAATPLRAQQRMVEKTRLADGTVLDYGPNGGWRAKVRNVVNNRARMLAAGNFAGLNAPKLPQGGSAAVGGTLSIPAILIAFKNTDTAILPRVQRYDSVLFSPVPPLDRPYTLQTYYKEVSNNMLTFQGKTYGWVQADSNSAYYGIGACTGATADPFDCVGTQRWHDLFIQVLGKVDDGSVNWGQYDNDGPDGIPNSGDDDGVVDFIQFIQPVVGIECGGKGEGAHHFQISFLGGPAYTTKTPRTGGGFIKVDYYQIVSGVGGLTCTNTSQIMGPGTSAHETGHGLGLPDLYDTGPASSSTEGIGEWGIMGSGNYTSLLSPAHHDAWSKQQLGWVTVLPLTTSGTYTLRPVVLSDTIFYVAVQGNNPRGEYFLVENKQPAGSDTSNMLSGEAAYGGSAPGKVGGLVVWHIDGTQVAAGWQLFTRNSVNVGSIHGVAVVQADGLRQLDLVGASGNRGDKGDAYPGSTSNAKFSFGTNPAALKNSDGSFIGFELDSIKQVVPFGAMSFALHFGGIAVVRAATLAAQVSVDGVKYSRFVQLLSAGTTHTIAIDSAQSADGFTQYVFGAWSDGGARTHTFTATQAGDSISATVTTKFLLKVTAGTGIISSPSASAAVLETGQFIAKDSVVMVIATPPTHGVLDTWVGDTIASGDTLTLTMTRPFTVTANFLAPTLSAPTVTQQILGLSAPLSKSDIRYLDLLGNNNGKFDLGDFLAWVKETGATPSTQRVATVPAAAPREMTVAKRGEQ